MYIRYNRLFNSHTSGGASLCDLFPYNMKPMLEESLA